ncbi:MAG TPA: type II toxin-antitoxin system HicA family toxin [Tepidisphaeraceae bacterium]|nr:type II toxin-antitoxin system HicA family toxin [Tepidisphaeraceae bacterium]
MPKKIRELKATLTKAGFRWRPGKGSHTRWEHPLASKPVVLSGNDARDARRYQEEQVRERIEEVRRRQR